MERTITPGMSPFEKFAFGDSVAHISQGDGMVTKNDGREISVKYANGARGTYDADWFRIHPTFLFHRS